MALLDVLKYHAPDDSVFVWKHPGDKIKIGAQLIVNEGQQAVFVKGGQALDVFGPGTHSLSTGNIPLLEKLVNLPFGGKTPFSAEVWYVNTTVKRDLKWGTAAPIPLMDATLGFPVSVRSFGKWGARITDARSFVTQLVGSQVSADANKVREYFIGEIIQGLTKHLSSVIARGEASVLQVAALVSEVSEAASDVIKQELLKFGVELVNFNIESINIPDDEMRRIQDVYAKTLEARELSKADVGQSYATIKSFEVMNNAAQNPSEVSVGTALGAGIGLGAGFPLGQQMGEKLDVGGSEKSAGSAADPTDRLRQLKELLEEGLITQEQFEQKRDEILKEF